jgi:PAS domain S-box-containing protein
MWVFVVETFAFLAVNETAVRFYGYSRKEFLCMTIMDIRPPEAVPKLRQFLSGISVHEPPGFPFHKTEWQHRKKDGGVLDVEVVSNPITFEGRPARLVAINDVTPRNEARRVAERRLSELQTLYQQAPLGLAFLDRDLRYVKINEHLARMNGRPVAEHLGRTVREMIPRLADTLEPILRKVIEMGEPVENFQLHESVPEHSPSELFWQGSYHAVKDSQGRVLGVNVAVMDVTGLKGTENALRENQERLSLILENVKDFAIFTLDLQGNITTWNIGAQRIFGYAPGEILGRHSATLFIPEDRAAGAADEELTRARETDFSPDDRWHLRKDGTRFFVSGTVRPLKDEGGRPQGFIKVARDITARRQMRQQLEARLRQQAAVANLSHMALFGGDDQALMDQATKLITQTLGVEMSKVLELLPGGTDMLLRAGVGWKPGQIGNTHVGAGRESQSGYTLSSDRPVISDDLSVEKRFKIPDLLIENQIMSSITVIIKGDQSGGSYGVLGACSTRPREFSQDDVNFLQSVANVLAAALQRKRFESALTESEQRFRELANAMPQIVWVTRADGQPEYYNQRWYDYTGLSEEESMAQHGWKKILHPDDLPICFDRLTNAAESGKPYEAECRYRDRKDGQYRWHLIRAVPIKDEPGRIVRWFGSSTDIDDQKRANEALEKAREQLRSYADHLEKMVAERTTTLEESIQSLEGVLYHVAHDLRAPLRAMQGLTTLLLEEYAPHFDVEGREYAGRIIDSAARMDSLIRDLLAYGRLGHVNLPLHRVDLEKAVDLALDLLGEEITGKAAKVIVQRPIRPVMGNETLVNQILINLVSNALKFVAPGNPPRIQISSETDGKTVVLSVQDNGIGISDEHLERIFRVFERLHRVEEYPGTGIGLAIVTKGAERMGGRVGVESQPGHGSRFWLELPIFVERQLVKKTPSPKNPELPL